MSTATGKVEMSASRGPVVSVFVCHRCIPAGAGLARQWEQDGVHVRVTELPCSGKTDVQYMFHALEGGATGVLVVTCPQGDCRLSQGNYRAAIRVGTVQRLLTEIGLEAGRAVLTHCGPEDNLEALVRDQVKRIASLGPSALHEARQIQAAGQ